MDDDDSRRSPPRPAWQSSLFGSAFNYRLQPAARRPRPPGPSAAPPRRDDGQDERDREADELLRAAYREGLCDIDGVAIPPADGTQ